MLYVLAVALIQRVLPRVTLRSTGQGNGVVTHQLLTWCRAAWGFSRLHASLHCSVAESPLWGVAAVFINTAHGWKDCSFLEENDFPLYDCMVIGAYLL